MPSASAVFDFLDDGQELSVRRYEIASPPFGILRGSVRGIIIRLADSDDPAAREVSERFRAKLSEWLTVPVPFNCAIEEVLRSAGEPSAIQSRWGADIRSLHDAAVSAAQAMSKEENPLRACLREVIPELRSSGKSFKIYCHRSAVPHFQSVFSQNGEAALSSAAFLHSVRDYRDSETFDVLLKVGPLRARGWGYAPDAILSAPRFSSLIQFVWAGCADEPGFGYDPVSPPEPPAGQSHPASNRGAKALSHRIFWKPEVIRLQTNDTVQGFQAPVDEDDFHILTPLSRSASEKCRATLLEVDDGQGILFRPLARVMSFDPRLQDSNAIDHRLPGDSLFEGMYVIRSLVADIDFGGVRAGHGHYSRTWKARLRQELHANPHAFESRLRAAGLELVHLGAAIQNWCADPTTVIHAPQQIRHFEILLSVLGLGDDSQNAGLRWWQRAWNEVRRSRGEAIQAGVQGQEIVEEQMIALLRSLLPQIRLKASAGSGFHLEIPSGHEMTGAFLFFKVFGLEEGFLAPETELKVVRELNTLEQWRV